MIAEYPTKPGPLAQGDQRAFDAPKRLRPRRAGWAAAWSSKDFLRYRGYYAKDFASENGQSLEQWASERAVRLGKPGDISVGINDLKVDTTNPDKAITEFSQSYASANYSDVVPKRMEWVREGNRWKIQREQVLEAPKISVPQLMKPTPKKHRAKNSRKNCECK